MKTRLLFLAMLFSGSLFAQLNVKSTGRIEMSAQTGGFSVAPCIYLNSNATSLTGGNTGLNLCNTNTTTNNWIRFHFATKKTNGVEEDFVSLGTQFKNRTAGSESADFHITTFNRGYYNTRFGIYNNSNNVSYVRFYYSAGSGNGIWMDDSGGGEATIRPGSGNFGYLGTTDHYWFRLYVAKACYNSHSSITSDKRTKNTIQDIDEGTMQRLRQVRGVKYKINQKKLEETISSSKDMLQNNIFEENGRKQFSEKEIAEGIAIKAKELEKAKAKEHFGFIAQELIEIFPEVVDYDEKNDSYGVQYTALIPIIIEGMKEQQAIIEAQSLKLKEHEALLVSITKNEGKIINTKLSNAQTEESRIVTNAFLYQNVPNPFSIKTEIKYYIPENVKNAALYIFNMQGSLLKTENILKMGQGSIIINGSELSSGIYIYSLVIEGQEVDTKRMILTE